MSLSDSNATIIGKELFNVLEKRLVGAVIANRQYEGDVRECGSAVKICGVSQVWSDNYTGSISYSTLDVASATLNINLARYVAFNLDDTNAAQSCAELWTPYVRNAGYTLADYMDSQILSAAALGASNSTYSSLLSVGWTAGSSGANIPKIFAKVGQLLDAANVPNVNRYIVVPPEVMEAIRVWAAGRDSTFASGIQENGLAGNFFGMNVHVSNNLTTDAQSNKLGVAGVYGMGVAFVEQVSKSEIVRRDSAFANAYRALVLGGAKVYQASALVKIVWNSNFTSDM